MEFVIPNQMRRNLAVSRLRREGYDARPVTLGKGDPGHTLEVREVEDVAAVEALVEQMASARIAVETTSPLD